jgi:WD40 repeat protein
MTRSVFLILCGICWLAGLNQIIFGQQPELVAQTGHSDVVNSVAFSVDGKMLASGSDDRTIKLWEIETGRELKTLKGDFGVVSAVTFSADGKVLASGSLNTIKLWDTATGKELKTFKAELGGISSVLFSADGKILASKSHEEVKLWDVATGKELRTLKGHAGNFKSIAFSPDGKVLASGGNDHFIRLWDVASGRELKNLSGHSNYVYSLAFSPNGTILASGSDKEIKFWETATGRELKTLTGHSYAVNALVFSPDGKRLASRSSSQIKLWDTATGRELKALVEESASVDPLALSSDGKMLASGSYRAIKLWDAVTGRELKTLRGHSHGIDLKAFSPDGKTLATESASVSDTIKLWDVATGREIRSLKGNSFSVKSMGFSSDGKMLASGGFQEIKLWDTAAGRELKTLQGHELTIYSVTFSADGTMLASGSDDNTIKLWDVAAGRELKTLAGHTDMVTSTVFSPDGKMLASGSNDSTVKLWDVEGGREQKTLKGHAEVVTSVTFSADGKTLASGSLDKTIKLWNPATGQELKTLKGHTVVIASIAFSPTGEMLASRSDDNTLKLWDTTTGQEVKPDKLPGWLRFNDQSGITRINDKTIHAQIESAQIRLVNLETKQTLATLIAIDENDWLVTTPEGFFDGTSNAWKQLIWRFSDNIFDYGAGELYFNDFYYPNLLQDVLAGKTPRPPQGRELTKIDRRQPTVTFSTNERTGSQLNAPSANPTQTVNRKATISIVVSDNAGRKRQANHNVQSGAQDLRLFRSGSLVRAWRGDVFKLGAKDGCQQIAPVKAGSPRRVRCQAEVPIVAGTNGFTAYAFNSSNVKSEDARLNINGAESLKRKGAAYIVAVGVNAYANAQYNLKYAVADARDFGAELKRQQEQLGNYERVELVALFDQDATKEKILQALRALQGRTEPEDAVIVYFAGHGTAERQKFFLIPHDLGYMGDRKQLTPAGLNTILARSISDRELEQAFEKIDAGQFLLVIDACNSGQALETEEKRRGPMNSKGLAQLAYEKGMYILTAAQSYQAALEAAQLGHGYLTYALIEEGLKKAAADKEPSDGRIMVREWFNYASERVPRMQEEKMKAARDLVFVEGEERTVEGGQRNVQRPRLFYRRELEAQPLIVAMSESAQPKQQ